jgi:hypothetical protein
MKMAEMWGLIYPWLKQCGFLRSTLILLIYAKPFIVFHKFIFPCIMILYILVCRDVPTLVSNLPTLFAEHSRKGLR